MSLFRAPVMSPKTRARWGSTVAARLERDPRVSRIPTDHVQAYFVEAFLDAAQCAALMAIIDSNRRPSTTLATDGDPLFRTSESCDMDRWVEPVASIDSAIADLLGIPRENGETLQGQRYAPGQHFRAHHDYFHAGQDYFADVTKQGGQRTWTAMIYLNAVEGGGATWFPQGGFRVEPHPGLLLVWNNMKPDGNPNIDTIHEGMAVETGTKYIVTKWFREGRWLPA